MRHIVLLQSFVQLQWRQKWKLYLPVAKSYFSRKFGLRFQRHWHAVTTECWTVGRRTSWRTGAPGHAPCSLTSKTLARPDSCATSLTWLPPIVTSTTTTTAIENVILWSISLIRKKIEALKRIFVQHFSFKVCIFIDFLNSNLKDLIVHFESILKPAL